MQFLSVESQAVGVIAIGGHARGVIAIGQSAEGVIAIGQVALGVVAIGQLARGVIVVGQLGLGGWAWGQATVGLVRAVGMLAIAARAGGMLPVSFWPAPVTRDRPKPELVSLAELASGARSVGWIAARIEPRDGGVELLVDGVRAPEVVIAEDVAFAAKSRGASDVLALVRGDEVLASSDEGGFREAPTRSVRLTVTDVEWPPRWSQGDKIGAVAGLLLVLPLLAWVAAIPLAQSLIALARA